MAEIKIDMSGISAEQKPKYNYPKQDVPWEARHPNLYGLYGATKETAKTLLPFVHYIEKSERDRLVSAYQLDTTQEEIDKVLMSDDPSSFAYQNLNKEMMGDIVETMTWLTGGAEMKPISDAAKKWFSKQFPKTYQFMTKKIGTAKKIEKPKTSAAQNEDIQTGTQPLPKSESLRLEEIKKMKEGILDPSRDFTLPENRRVMYEMADAIKEDPTIVRQILEAYDTTPEELADELIRASSEAGKKLNQLSQVKRAMERYLPKEKEALEKLTAWDGKTPPMQHLSDTIFRWWKKIDQPRRMMLVSQLATATRNFVSQTGRYSVEAFDSALTNMMMVGTGQKSVKHGVADFAEIFMAVWRTASPKARKELNELIFDKFPKTKSELFSAPIHDVTLGGKISKMLMFPNTVQENIFRRAAFDSKARQLARKHGIDLNKINELSPQKQKWVEDNVFSPAVKQALEMTFAKPPELKWLKESMKLWTEIPLLTTIQPFPRFWANSIKFLFEYNPIGALINTGVKAGYKQGGEEITKAISKGLVGSSMLLTAMQLRQSEYAGEKWYEIKTGKTNEDGTEQYIDMRAFAPFTQYLFMAEALLTGMGKKENNFGPRDYAEGVLSINRVAGTGMVLLDALSESSNDTFFKNVMDFAGQFLGGYSVGARTAKDFLAEIDPEQAVVHSTGERPITGPFMENFPTQVSEAVGYETPAPAQRLTRDEPYSREEAGARQLTGITVKSKDEIQKEIDRLGVRGLFPKTGDRILDNKITDAINGEIAERLPELINHPKYNELSRTAQKAEVRSFVSDIKKGMVDRVGVPHYVNMANKMRTNEQRKKLVLKLAKKRRLSLNGVMAVVKKSGIELPEKDKREILDLYR